MSDTSRQEGFWWAKARWHAAEDPSWKVAEVRNGKLHYGGDWWPLASAEWGPYLGREPVETLRHVACWMADTGKLPTLVIGGEDHVLLPELRSEGSR